jgi:NTP pyrophosphatase (non-canonical NTP hydrolase)
MSQANSFVSVVNEGETSPSLIRYDQFVRRLFKVESMKDMAMHAALGICGEAGELGDAIKKSYVYGKPIDIDNVIEELGDLRFYIQAVMQLFNLTEQEILQYNVNKLAKRYKELTYSDAAAITRSDKVDPRTDSN